MQSSLAAGLGAALILTLAPAAICAEREAGAPAGAEAVKAAIGNTIVETYPDGRKGEIWLAGDGSYTGEGRRHDKSDGHWSVSGGELCFKQSHPFVFGARFCTPIPKVSLGESWQAKAATGEPITVRVVPGHVIPS
jgi:hypothetical protein